MKIETGRRKTWTLRALLAVAAFATVRVTGAPVSLQAAGQQGAKLATPVPVFEVDPAWPQKLPYNWIVGHVASLAVDSRDQMTGSSTSQTDRIGGYRCSRLTEST